MIKELADEKEKNEELSLEVAIFRSQHQALVRSSAQRPRLEMIIPHSVGPASSSSSTISAYTPISSRSPNINYPYEDHHNTPGPSSTPSSLSTISDFTTISNPSVALSRKDDDSESSDD